MKKIRIKSIIFAIFLLTLIGCSNKGDQEYDLNQLTRVDVVMSTEENKEQETIIMEEEKLETIREVIESIDWEQNVKSEMTRKEDFKVTLFITEDKNMPERLYEYFILFNQSDGSATIIDREKNAVGTLDKENAQMLNEILTKN
ncbi:hypothetical protein AM500_13120 [Bacillus sp. FJAT-18017]|uniref:hypothetical protein n=1 Tax=Bacillus sp. FJAT-18017 TaxID=1705566 RepID=UPI0006AF197B|nr:hypothetical protein [Bacillus sp. FJAT-18017]ALC90622.1 hypothetical protein AM500_13120 [Bacillus sp. FJAT-18017]